MGRSFLVKAASVAALSFAAASVSTANAQSTTTSLLNFTGSANVQNQPGSNGANLLIDFLTNGTATPGAAGTITAVPTISGAFMPGIANGTMGTIQDLVFSGNATGNNVVSPGPTASFVSIGGYTFTLTNAPNGSTFGPVTLNQIGSSTFAAFAVNGTVTGGTFDARGQAYTGVFTAQFAGQTPDQVFNSINSGTTVPVGFSAEFAVAAASTVPEPSTYALLATGIGALGFVARRRRTQA